MTRLFCAFLLSLWALPALGQTVRVTSGDHNGFTRLVLAIGSSEWRVGRVEGGFGVALSNTTTFDTTRAFDRIRRDRVTSLADLGGGRLLISADCACHVSALEVGGGYLAVDIRDGDAQDADRAYNAPLDRSVTEAATPAAQPQPPEPTNATPQAATAPAARRDPPTPTISLPLLGDTQFSTIGTTTTPLPASEPAASPPPASQSDRASETEAALLEQIARAAAQGLLDANIPEPTPPIETVAQPESPARPAPPLPAPIGENSHVSITTSVDSANNDALSGRTDSGANCFDDRFFTVSEWGLPIENGADIGNYRSGIIGEFDEADGEGVTALVRHYIYITFGAEAKAVIARYVVDIERPDILSLMADVMDHAQSGNAKGVIDQMACPGPVALWATAAQPELFGYQSIDTIAVRRAFLELPPHIRRHMGPSLAAKFLAIDDQSTADAIQNATERLFEGPSPELGLLEARRDLADGRPDAAREKLDEVVTAADDLLPEALIERVEAALAEGEAVPDDVISLLQSVGFEHRGTETGAALARTEIRAYASAAQYATAFDRLDAARSDGTATGKTAVDLNREVFRLLVQDQSDAEFLARTVARLGDAAVLPQDLRHAIIRRLLDLGFAAQARIILGGDGTLPSPKERRLYAEIAIAQQKPGIAIGYLAGLEDPEATALRARAYALAEDHQSAAAAFAGLGDAAAAQREAWQGGDWDAISAQNDTAFGAASSLMRDLSTTSTDPSAPPLARSEALIDASRETRVILSDLLDAIPAQEVQGDG